MYYTLLESSCYENSNATFPKSLGGTSKCSNFCDSRENEVWSIAESLSYFNWLYRKKYYKLLKFYIQFNPILKKNLFSFHLIKIQAVSSTCLGSHLEMTEILVSSIKLWKKCMAGISLTLLNWRLFCQFLKNCRSSVVFWANDLKYSHRLRNILGCAV